MIRAILLHACTDIKRDALCFKRAVHPVLRFNLLICYEPCAGDIIFFDWDSDGQDGSSDHVGIVDRVEDGVVYTVEGNSGDSCRQNSYPIGYYEILGYGTPAY